MNEETILGLVKESIGIRSSTTRDDFIRAIIRSVIQELQDEKGINLEPNNMTHVMFITDMSAWRYNNRETKESMPRHLQFRLHNLIIHNKAVET